MTETAWVPKQTMWTRVPPQLHWDTWNYDVSKKYIFDDAKLLKFQGIFFCCYSS